MPRSAASSHSDAALLIAVQAGDHALSFEFYRRFSRRLVGMIRKLRPGSSSHYQDDALGTVMLMLLNPRVKRFVLAEGTLVQYLFRRLKNAVKETDRHYRPAIVNRQVTPKTDEVERPRRDAATVYDNTTRQKGEQPFDFGFADRETVAVVMAKADPVNAQIAYLRHVEGFPVTQIAAKVGIDRFAVARRLKRFQCEAVAYLALAEAA